MNTEYMSEALQEKVKPKFGRKKKLKARAAVHFPDTLARDYRRIANAYLALFNKTLAEHMPKIRKAIDAERNANERHDSVYDVLGLLKHEFDKIQAEFLRRAKSFGLEDRLRKLAERTRRLSVSEWKRVVHQTLGINILDDYYLGKFFQDNLTQWIKTNVGLIKRVPPDTLYRMNGIVERGFINGMSNTAIGELIQREYGMCRQYAQMLARDQIASLNAEITEKQQRDAGVESYIWSASKDSRVRDCHADYDGKEFRWDDPPEDYYETKTKGRVYTGERFHPGEAVCCLPGNTKVDFSNGCNKLFRRRYTSPIVNVVLSDGTVFQATPNHPCLTDRGWLPVNSLNEGDHIVQAVGNGGFVFEYNNNEFVPSIGDCFESLSRTCGTSKTRITEFDFHGDGIEGDVDIIDTEGFLSDYFESEHFKTACEFILAKPLVDAGETGFDIGGFCEKSFRMVDDAVGFVRFANQLFSFIDTKLTHPYNIRFACTAPSDSIVSKDCCNNPSIGIERLGQGKLAISGDIPLDYLVLWQLVLCRLFPTRRESDVVLAKLLGEGFVFTRNGFANGSDCFATVYTARAVKEKFVTEFTGHVYNLQNNLSWYSITQSRTVVHNCRCVALPVFGRELTMPWENDYDKLSKAQS